jgi:diguanylate cyclase (GGDEF)-like protein/PAS domain S-box-containing protein
MEGMHDKRLALLDSALGVMNLGLVVLDHEHSVVLWNRWMEQHSGVTAAEVEGQDFFVLFEELAGKRVQQAVQQALRDNFPSILSQTLHKSPFPLYASAAARAAGERIQQAVAITPLNVADGARHCLIQITDVSMAVAREKLLREQAMELRSQTFSDGLTGIANRRHFGVALEKEFRRAKRNATPLSLLMIDIDAFKPYNDYYGHQLGDESLIKVAHALARMLQRPTDLIARYGGEEFAVILPDMPMEKSVQLAEAMRVAISDLAIPHARASHSDHVTVSIGVATQTEDDTRDLGALLGAADRALYAAKHAGRNRVVTEVRGHAAAAA